MDYRMLNIFLNILWKLKAAYVPILNEKIRTLSNGLFLKFISKTLNSHNAQMWHMPTVFFIARTIKYRNSHKKQN